MDKYTFLKLLNNVNQSIFYKDIDDSLKSKIAKHYKFTFLLGDELSKAIDKLKAFDINKLWDKGFWGLKVNESISAVATEPYNTLRRIIKSNEIV